MAETERMEITIDSNPATETSQGMSQSRYVFQVLIIMLLGALFSSRYRKKEKMDWMKDKKKATSVIFLRAVAIMHTTRHQQLPDRREILSSYTY